MSKSDYNPDGIKRLARAMVCRALRDYIHGELNIKTEVERFMRSDFVELMGQVYDFDPEFIIKKAEEYRKKKSK